MKRVMTAEQVAAHNAKMRGTAVAPIPKTGSPARSKYGARACEVNGERYDSQKEMRRHQELLLMEKAGAISGLKRQESFLLIPAQAGERACSYLADFTYIEDGIKIVEDVKSTATKTPAYIIKRKLMLRVFGIVIRET